MVQLKETEQRLRNKGADVTSAVQNTLGPKSIGDLTFHHHHQCDMQNLMKGTTSTLSVVECRSSEREHDGAFDAHVK